MRHSSHLHLHFQLDSEPVLYLNLYFFFVTLVELAARRLVLRMILILTSIFVTFYIRLGGSSFNFT